VSAVSDDSYWSQQQVQQQAHQQAQQQVLPLQQNDMYDGPAPPFLDMVPWWVVGSELHS
jgi:hypothetical protein